MPRRVLVIEGAAEVRQLMWGQLRSAFPELEIEEATSREELARAVDRGDFEIAVGAEEPGFGDGLLFLRIVQARWPGRPTVLITHHRSEATSVESTRAGIDDYVQLDPSDGSTLARAVAAALAPARQLETLRIVESGYRQMFDTVPIAALRLAPDGQILRANAAVEPILACADRRQLVHRNLGEFFLEQDEFRAWLGRAVGSDVHQRAEVLLRREDGVVIWALVSARAVRGARGGSAFLGCTLHDITEQRAATEALRFLAEASRQLSATLDPDRAVESLLQLAVPRVCDSCMIDLRGPDGRLRPHAELLTSPDHELLAAELRGSYADRPRPPHPLAEALELGRPLLHADVSDDLLASIARDSKRLAPLRALCGSCMVVPLQAPGRLLGVMTFLSRGRRRFGKADLPLASELAGRAALAMENARLYREAREAIMQRDEFLSTAAHELRTPLTTLMGYAELLLLDGGAAPQNVLAAIDRQCQRIDRLIGRLLDLTRLRLGRFDLTRQPLDLRASASEVVERMQVIAPGHRLAVAAGEPVVALADPERIEQVLTNLIENAIRFSPEGGDIEVTIGREPVQAVVSVRDSGVGIPADEQAGIFDPSRRVPRTSTRGFGGMGLGLTICRDLIERHGGKIWFESEAGRGSTFRFSLPLAAGDDHEPRS